MFKINGLQLPEESIYCENLIDLDQELFLLHTLIKNKQYNLFEHRIDRFPMMVKGYINEGQPFPTQYVKEFEKMCDLVLA